MDNRFDRKLTRIVNESIRKVLSEGIFGYPDGIDYIILDSENDKECVDIYEWIFNALLKRARKGEELSFDRLVNSSVMKKYQQLAFRKFKQEQMEHSPMSKEAPFEFRKYVSEKMINDVQDYSEKNWLY